VDVHHGHEEWLPGWADELARVDPSFLDGRRPTVEGGSISRCGLDILSRLPLETYLYVQLHHTFD
jgi:hypothetical protein